MLLLSYARVYVDRISKRGAATQSRDPAAGGGPAQSGREGVPHGAAVTWAPRGSRTWPRAPARAAAPWAGQTPRRRRPRRPPRCGAAVRGGHRPEPAHLSSPMHPQPSPPRQGKPHRVPFARRRSVLPRLPSRRAHLPHPSARLPPFPLAPPHPQPHLLAANSLARRSKKSLSVTSAASACSPSRSRSTLKATRSGLRTSAATGPSRKAESAKREPGGIRRVHAALKER
jgi:hypothetical protein